MKHDTPPMEQLDGSGTAQDSYDSVPQVQQGGVRPPHSLLVVYRTQKGGAPASGAGEVGPEHVIELCPSQAFRGLPEHSYCSPTPSL